MYVYELRAQRPRAPNRQKGCVSACQATNKASNGAGQRPSRQLAPHHRCCGSAEKCCAWQRLAKRLAGAWRLRVGPTHQKSGTPPIRKGRPHSNTCCISRACTVKPNACCAVQQRTATGHWVLFAAREREEEPSDDTLVSARCAYNTQTYHAV